MSGASPLRADTTDAAYVGLDLGTYALKAVGMQVLADGKLEQTHAVDVVYERDLPAFSPVVRIVKATGAATSAPRLFLAALDLGLERLRDAGFPMGHVVALSGSAQMHGSVYVTSAFADSLRQADPGRALHDALPGRWLALLDAPVWLDASTAAQCALLEHELDGPAGVAAVSGSRAYERFTGPQVRKRADADGPFHDVARVFLISSFLASCCVGCPVPEDVGDASGTNMFEVESVPPRWWPAALRACGAVGLLSDAPVEGWAAVGRVSSYFQQRYGLPETAVCCAWSGDNPNTIASYGGLDEGDLVISLGTSDTAQWKSSCGRGALFGHTFRSPLSSSKSPEYFRMLCYSNGSRTREAVRDAKFACSDAPRASGEERRARTWAEFDNAINSTEPGCGPELKVGVFHLAPEIVPRSGAEPHVRVYSVPTCEAASARNWAETCRLSVESRALAILEHGRRMDGKNFCPRRILLAGGGSASQTIPQVLADVLRAPVFAFAGAASAAAGAARRAHHCRRVLDAGAFVPFGDGVAAEGLRLVATPREKYFAVYSILGRCFSDICNPES